MTEQNRYALGTKGALIGLAINIFLVALKGIGGILSGSIALVADAFHSASDSAASIAVLIGLKIANKPPDEEHPYGHGKAESIAAKVVAFILVLAGLEIASTSIRSLFAHDMPEPPETFAIWISAVTIIIKEILFRYKMNIGKKTNNKAIIANAMDHRADALSSIAAFIGISTSIYGTQLGLPYSVYADPLAGAIVSVFVIKMGWNIFFDAAGDLMDKSLAKKDLDRIELVLKDVQGVEEIHEIRGRQMGPQIVVDLKIGVDDNITVREGHNIAVSARNRLIEQYDDIHDVLVHVNPRRWS
jgi:cation diffusion facilitator family transporter